MRVLSLFSGIGLHDLGLERAGMQTVAFCESDPWCRAVLAKHWPETWCHDDVSTLTGDAVRERVGAVDLVTGGFPCQDVSVAGKGVGLGGERSGLWWHMHRVIQETRPSWLLIENVRALRLRGADGVLAALEEDGYACWPVVVGAIHLGIGFVGQRVWIVAKAGGEGLAAGRPLSFGTKSILARSPRRRVSGRHEPQQEWESRRMVEPRLGGATDGRARRLDRFARRNRLKALGNANPPHVPELIGRWIMRQENP